MSEVKKINYPFGKAEEISKAYAATIAADIDINETQLTIAQMTGAATLNLTVRSEVLVGSNLTILVSADGTNRALTPGTGMTGNAVTVTANKTFLIMCKYDGTNFRIVSALVQN